MYNIACSKYAKDTDISDGFEKRGYMDGYYYDDCLDYTSLFQLLKKIKENSLSSKTFKKTAKKM